MTGSLIRGDQISCSRVGGAMRRESWRLRQQAQSLNEALAELATRADPDAGLPGQAGLAVYSPPLDPKGNSLRGVKVFEELSSRFSLHFMEVLFHNNTIGHAIGRAAAGESSA